MATRKSAAQGASKSSPPSSPTSAAKPAAKVPQTRVSVKTVAKAVAKAAPGGSKALPKAAKAVPAAPKAKLVRDSFTIPKSEYLVIGALKLRVTGLGRHAKKSELLRAGIALLNTLGDKALLAALDAVPSLKTGRPLKDVEAPAKPAAKTKKS